MVRVTAAFGMAEPDESCTMPAISASPVCASAAAANMTIRTDTKTLRLTMLEPMSKSP